MGAVSERYSGRYTPRPSIMAGSRRQYSTMPATSPSANDGTLGMPDTIVATTDA